MIPSSIVAFQVITAIIAFITIVTWGLTAYLLAFHLYLCKLKIIKIIFFPKRIS